MKFKLDETLGRSAAKLLREAGHDVETVPEEGLSGAADESVLSAATGEERVLLTLDFDFSNPMRFPPSKSAGIVVIVPGRRVSNDQALERIRELLRVLETEELGRNLWIVEPGRDRIHEET